MVLAADIALPWPIALLLTFAGILVALAGGITLVRSASIKANLELLRGERDDYKEAWEHAKQDRDELEQQFQEHTQTCSSQIQTLEGKVQTLSNVVSGASAVKELGDLLVMMNSSHHQEVLGAVNGTRSELKSSIEALLHIFGEKADE